MVIERLKNPEKEIERTYESLKKLPYVSFGIRHNRVKAQYFVGVTDDVYVMYLRDRIYKYELLGKYIVAIPWDSIIISSLDGFHFIPMSNIYEQRRHYHHHASFEGNSKRHKKNPLDWSCSTCWGSAGSMIVNALSIADIAAIFESAFIFLQKVDYYDRYAEVEWGRRITEQEYIKATGVSLKALTDQKYPEVIF